MPFVDTLLGVSVGVGEVVESKKATAPMLHLCDCLLAITKGDALHGRRCARDMGGIASEPISYV
jgi:hypothetical protein